MRGYSVDIVDNFDNSAREVLARIAELVGANAAANLTFHEVDLLDRAALDAVFAAKKGGFEAVIHFAGLKAVGESVQKPLRYYHNNVTGTLVLLEVMGLHGCKQIVFSSSATVYGQPEVVPADETALVGATNPYGRTKLFIEEILRDVCTADAEWRVALLRYFNPVGAHASGRIGEDPKGIPNNLMPFVQQVAVGRRPQLTVFGADYPTPDGTGVRDYIHVVDLAEGHIAALQKLAKTEGMGCKHYNLGTGRGTSVLEIVKAFEAASGKEIPYVLAERRAGDCAEVYAATDLAEKELGWRANRSIADMCEDQWRWASSNPYGYEAPPPPNNE